MTQNMITWEMGVGGVVVLTMDDPDQGANTLNDTFRRSLSATVERLEADRDEISGVILTSAKKTFFAGADLHWLKDVTPDDTAVLVDAAGQVGLDEAEAAELLSDERYARDVREQERFWLQQGIHAVPSFILDRRYLIPGAQEADVLVAALERIRYAGANAAEETA